MPKPVLPSRLPNRPFDHFSFAPKRVAIALSGIMGVLLLLHIGVSIYNHQVNYTLPQHLTRIVGVDVENSIPTWYSSTLLLVCCGLLTAIAFVKKQLRDRYIRHWQGLAVLFLLLSLDEAASIHETLDRALKLWFNPTGWLYYVWVVPALIFVSLLGLTYWQFLQKLPLPTRWLFIGAGIVYIGGAIGMEILGGSQADLYGRYNLGYTLISTIEETLEMSGVILFVYALLSYLQGLLQSFTTPIRFASSRDEEANYVSQ